MFKYEHSEDGKIDFKKSSFKKITKFLKKMKQKKLISFSKLKGVDHEVITGINRKACEKAKIPITGFRKVIQTEDEEEEKKVEEVKGAPNKSYPLVEITQFYKVGSKELAAVFEDIKEDGTQPLSIDDCREIISKYIEQNELEHPSRRNNAILDPNLVKLVKNKNDIKTDPKTGQSIANKGALFKDIEIFLRPFHLVKRLNVVSKDTEKVKAGYIPKVKIVIEKFMNKNVTRILSLETWEIDFKDACHVLQVKLAVGVSVCQKEKSYSSEHIKIQGIHPERVENILIEEF